MKTTNRILWLLLAFAVLLSLCACGESTQGEEAEIIVIGEPQISAETEPGFITAELPMPESYQDFGGLQSFGDSLYLHAVTPNGGFAVLRYDTLTDEWQSWALETGDAQYPRIEAFSVADGAVWVRLMEGYSDEEMVRGDFSRKLHY